MPREHTVHYLDKHGDVQTVKALTPEEGDDWPIKRPRKKKPVASPQRPAVKNDDKPPADVK